MQKNKIRFQLSASAGTKPRAMINAESKALSWIFSFVPDAKRFSMSAILITNPTRTGDGSSTRKMKRPNLYGNEYYTQTTTGNPNHD
jgi:hypothetical protein